MTKPNEDINEELSTEELKDVSGGIMVPGEGTNLKGDSPGGSRLGGGKKDWKESRKGIIDPADCPSFNPGETNPELIK
ncbi:hypothetical protein [Prochlorococcus marinus]|uniref:hypothetical protein n=1 Tax=Prochlorococcus marinus TaxID=1219 RepID=UPI0007B3663F|nr:hypothetical protein [Prochlorococcus marinus]KZR76726.1 hypothetical protein PMIT1320_00634 [Prochlorococcus marinus str. MIT 1320]